MLRFSKKRDPPDVHRGDKVMFMSRNFVTILNAYYRIR